MCDWTNLEEIMQDLTVAQRFEVPAAMEMLGAAGPISCKIEKEESEEQSYYASQGGGEGEFEGPDFKLIQEMLRVVKEKENAQQADDHAGSSDPESHDPEYLPYSIQKKMKRNVALESILSTKNAALSARRPVPQDIIHSMFKKKNSLNHIPHDNVEETSKNTPVEATSKNTPLSQTSSHFVKHYTPSTHANEYYMKYIQKSELREQFEEDIWAKAERQMKDLEARKKLEAEISSEKERASFDVNLPEHRHLMPGDCIVCIVAAKHGYYI